MIINYTPFSRLLCSSISSFKLGFMLPTSTSLMQRRCEDHLTRGGGEKTEMHPGAAAWPCINYPPLEPCQDFIALHTHISPLSALVLICTSISSARDSSAAVSLPDHFAPCPPNPEEVQASVWQLRFEQVQPQLPPPGMKFLHNDCITSDTSRAVHRLFLPFFCWWQ